MKMLSALAVSVILAPVSVLAACGSESEPSSDSSTPEAAVMSFMVGLEAGDCAAVKKIVVTPSTVDCEVVESLRGSYADEGTDVDDVSLEAGEVEGDSAVVAVGGDSEESFDVERIDGAWRVIFDTEE